MELLDPVIQLGIGFDQLLVVFIKLHVFLLPPRTLVLLLSVPRWKSREVTQLVEAPIGGIGQDLNDLGAHNIVVGCVSIRPANGGARTG